MEKFSNKEISRLFRNLAAAYMLLNEDKFRILAYQKAADSIENLNREIKDLWEENKLNTVPGVGPSMREHLDEYFRTGWSKHFNSVLSKIPESVFTLMRISSIGPKKAFKLVRALNLKNSANAVSDLKKAALDNKIATLESFGTKSQQEILEAIKSYAGRSASKKRMILPYAFEQAQRVIEYLKLNPLIEEVNALGSLRRMETTIGDIDLLVKVKGPKKEIINYFIKYPKTLKVENKGEEKASIIIPPDIRFDLRIEKKEKYGSMLQYFTGNKAHNILLREYALKKGYSLSEYGITNLKSQISNRKSAKKESSLIEFETEEKLYQFLKLQYIPPEIRQGSKEIDTASKNKIPGLVNLQDIKGDFHVHSSYDINPSHDAGIDDYETMIAYGIKKGYLYMGFTDHNPKFSLKEDEIVSIMKKRYEYLRRMDNEKMKVFIGLEIDIQPDGSLALPDKAFEYLDYSIVSVHSVFGMNRSEMTKRILRALSYPKVKILGHPTGRLINKRDGYDLEWEKIFETCRMNNIAIEVNSWPERLDLPDLLVHEAIDKGVNLFINTDAHRLSEMDNMFYGVSVARRGWATKKEILNTYPEKDLIDRIIR